MEKRMGIIWGVIALVLGLASMASHTTLISVILSLVAIVIAIRCISRKSKLYGLAIAGIVIALFNLVTYAISYETAQKEIAALQQAKANAVVGQSASSVRTTKTSTAAEGVDPDLVEFLDSYETFIDEYCEFMGKYYENPSDLSVLADYAEYMTKYADFAEKVEKYDSNNMSTADAAYYLEVTNRCTQKMLTIASGN